VEEVKMKKQQSILLATAVLMALSGNGWASDHSTIPMPAPSASTAEASISSLARHQAEFNRSQALTAQNKINQARSEAMELVKIEADTARINGTSFNFVESFARNLGIINGNNGSSATSSTPVAEVTNAPSVSTPVAEEEVQAVVPSIDDYSTKPTKLVFPEYRMKIVSQNGQYIHYVWDMDGNGETTEGPISIDTETKTVSAIINGILYNGASQINVNLLNGGGEINVEMVKAPETIIKQGVNILTQKGQKGVIYSLPYATERAHAGGQSSGTGAALNGEVRSNPWNVFSGKKSRAAEKVASQEAVSQLAGLQGQLASVQSQLAQANTTAASEKRRADANKAAIAKANAARDGLQGQLNDSQSTVAALNENVGSLTTQLSETEAAKTAAESYQACIQGLSLFQVNKQCGPGGSQAE
jgi:hypothetical protein